ncbi:unnamed protein product [Pleuronectes platessa]|uniref:Uncharacterized protein n=1 Tax=Pleuronectes platessa TaxID=8262 RepID=A0A9N7U5V3_PLEPL|nr:unnamed protein product [Pleuronectes platessa]
MFVPSLASHYAQLHVSICSISSERAAAAAASSRRPLIAEDSLYKSGYFRDPPPFLPPAYFLRNNQCDLAWPPSPGLVCSARDEEEEKEEDEDEEEEEQEREGLPGYPAACKCPSPDRVQDPGPRALRFKAPVPLRVTDTGPDVAPRGLMGFRANCRGCEVLMRLQLQLHPSFVAEQGEERLLLRHKRRCSMLCVTLRV